MTKTFKHLLFLYVLFDMFIAGHNGGLFPLQNLLAAQTILTQTTLASAVTSASGTTFALTSATGVTAGSTVLFIADGGPSETAFVNSVNGTNAGVTRGYRGVARAHVSGAIVFVAQPFQLREGEPTGACTRTQQSVLPAIATNSGIISDCIGGQWVQGRWNTESAFRVPTPNSGGTAYTALNTNGTTLAATTMYCTEINLPFNKQLTGLGVMNGTTVGTNNHLVVLYDATGNLLANSAVAGAVSAGASTYQTFAFTAKYYAVGPAQYFGCVQTNGTTDTIRMIVTGTQDTYLTKGVTSITFGTIPATITVPTTFTTAVGPYLEFY